MLPVLLILLAIVVIGTIIMVASKNSVNTAKNRVNEAYSTMDVYLKKRHDLIPNLVNTTKGYAKHESETLEKIADAASSAKNANTRQQSFNNEEKLDSATNSFYALAQAYPDLNSDATFNNLMNQLQSVEEDIANSRKYYNATVRIFNDKLTTYPSKFFAMHEEEMPYFQVTSEAERDEIEVQF